MSSSSNSQRPQIELRKGNLLDSSAQTLVNTVNCVGVMGKGIALAFKRRYPQMFDDYVRRCNQGRVRLGEPYPFFDGDTIIVNFPTKQHWRSVSRLEDIERGLDYLRARLHEWGITSIAVPPLGCGNGQLEWSVVGPTLHRHLSRFPIPVELYVPHDSAPDQTQLELFAADTTAKSSVAPRIPPALIAVVRILHRIEREPFHWPVGRVMFQKLTYFATMAGLPTKLDYEAASYGPYASDLKRVVARLQDNGLLVERQRGQMFEVRVGPTFDDALAAVRPEIQGWEPEMDRVVNLVSRFDTSQAEVASSVHFVAQALRERLGRPPTATEVVDGVEKWKIRRRPAIRRVEIEEALIQLATQRWIDVVPDDSIKALVEELVGAV